jgi:hypothetical protein
VAFLYIAEPTAINGFAVSSKGALIPLPGLPLAAPNLTRLSVTSKFLFGESGDGSVLNGYSISSKGSLTEISSINPFNYEPGDNYGCYDIPDLQVDFAGSTVYSQENPNCGNAAYASYVSFHIESNGDLQFLGNSGGTLDSTNQGPPPFLKVAGGDKFAYDSYCGEDEGDLPVIDIYKRESNGLLTYIGQNNEVPAGEAGAKYCVGTLATDSEDHVAVALQLEQSQDGDDGFIYGPFYLASYTANSKGNLTTKSTWENMPLASVGGTIRVTAMSISPSNKYLAVGGPQGVEVFHFNGSSPITKFSAAMPTGMGTVQFAWDKSNHLYALSIGAVYVYTVTSSGVKAVPGSPFLIPLGSSGMIVLAK